MRKVTLDDGVVIYIPDRLELSTESVNRIYQDAQHFEYDPDSIVESDIAEIPDDDPDAGTKVAEQMHREREACLNGFVLTPDSFGQPSEPMLMKEYWKSKRPKNLVPPADAWALATPTRKSTLPFAMVIDGTFLTNHGLSLVGVLEEDRKHANDGDMVEILGFGKTVSAKIKEVSYQKSFYDSSLEIVMLLLEGSLTKKDVLEGQVIAWEKTITSHKTAITRTKPSVPTRYLFSKGLISANCLDYGCGKGFDADWLTSKNIPTDKYDNYWFPNPFAKEYKTILCNYVLNTVYPHEINDIVENIRSLLAPGGMAYITVRNDKARLKGITKSGTLQLFVDLPFPVIHKTNDYLIYVIQG